MKIKKLYMLKIISIFIAGIFIINTASYGYALLSQSSLRVPLMSTTKEGQKKLEEILSVTTRAVAVEDLIKILPLEEMICGISVHTALDHDELCDWVEGNKNIPAQPNLLVLDSHVDGATTSTFRDKSNWLRTRRKLFGSIYVYISPLVIEGEIEMAMERFSFPDLFARSRYVREYETEAMERIINDYSDLGINIIFGSGEAAQIQGPTIISFDMDFFKCNFAGQSKPKRNLKTERAEKILNSLCTIFKAEQIKISGIDFTLTGEPFIDLKDALTYRSLIRKKIFDLLSHKETKDQDFGSVLSTQRSNSKTLDFGL